MYKMCVYYSVKEYVDLLQVSEELAAVRLAYRKAMMEKMDRSQKCPKCGQPTLQVTHEKALDEMGSIYCTFRTRESLATNGAVFYNYCDFEDVAENERYYFVEDLTFDLVAVMAKVLNIKNEKQVQRHLKMSWKEFVEINTSEMLLELQFE